LDGRTRVEERLDETLYVPVSRALKRAVIHQVDHEARDPDSNGICLAAFVRRAIRRELRRVKKA
jgi:hypothetical protein